MAPEALRAWARRPPAGRRVANERVEERRPRPPSAPAAPTNAQRQPTARCHRGERGGGGEGAEVREREDPRQRGGEARAPVPAMAEDHRAHEASPRSRARSRARGHHERSGGGGGGVEQRARHREHGEGADGAARARTVEDHAHRELHHAEREEEDAVGDPERFRRQREVARELGGDGGERGAIELADGGEGGEENDDAERRDRQSPSRRRSRNPPRNRPRNRPQSRMVARRGGPHRRPAPACRPAAIGSVGSGGAAKTSASLTGTLGLRRHVRLAAPRAHSPRAPADTTAAHARSTIQP